MIFEIMGVVNVTPDSFSDGNRFFNPRAAAEKIVEHFENGADYVDIGAESTRPGATAITSAQEIDRLRPVFEQLKGTVDFGRVSLDSRNDSTIEDCLDLGLGFINNVSGIACEATLRAIAKSKSTRYIAMHAHGEPKTMQHNPLSGKEIVKTVSTFFQSASQKLVDAGFSPSRIFMDPGIGFGKDLSANLNLLYATKTFAQNHNVLIGLSRKSFIGKLFAIEKPEDRDPMSKMLEFGVAAAGAKIIRTHDVKMLNHLRSQLEVNP